MKHTLIKVENPSAYTDSDLYREVTYLSRVKQNIEQYLGSSVSKFDMFYKDTQKRLTLVNSNLHILQQEMARRETTKLQPSYKIDNLTWNLKNM